MRSSRSSGPGLPDATADTREEGSCRRFPERKAEQAPRSAGYMTNNPLVLPSSGAMNVTAGISFDQRTVLGLRPCELRAIPSVARPPSPWSRADQLHRSVLPGGSGPAISPPGDPPPPQCRVSSASQAAPREPRSTAAPGLKLIVVPRFRIHGHLSNQHVGGLTLTQSESQHIRGSCSPASIVTTRSPPTSGLHYHHARCSADHPADDGRVAAPADARASPPAAGRRRPQARPQSTFLHWRRTADPAPASRRPRCTSGRTGNRRFIQLDAHAARPPPVR